MAGIDGCVRLPMDGDGGHFGSWRELERLLIHFVCAHVLFSRSFLARKVPSLINAIVWTLGMNNNVYKGSRPMRLT